MTCLTVQATDKSAMTVEPQGAPTSLARVKRSYLMPTPLGRAAASNDSRFDRPSQSRHALSAWARHASAGNGFGGEPPEAEETEAPADAMQIALAARVARAEAFWSMAFRGVHLVAAAARRAVAAWRRQRDEHATYQALSGLDQRTLRDIGIDRSEARSVAAELGGRADRTRARALMTLRSLSI